MPKARVINHRGDRDWYRKMPRASQTWTLLGDAATFETLKASGFLKPAQPETTPSPAGDQTDERR